MIQKFCKKSFLILVLAIFAGSFWATDHARGEAVTIEDMAGRSVSIEGSVQRIVCAGPGALRLIKKKKVQKKGGGGGGRGKKKNGGASVVFFFMQAEDGIRDLVRSRGLVYSSKRRHTIWAYR